jgi:hypothetical protein
MKRTFGLKRIDLYKMPIQVGILHLKKNLDISWVKWFVFGEGAPSILTWKMVFSIENEVFWWIEETDKRQIMDHS